MRPVLYVSIVVMLTTLGAVAWNEAHGFELRYGENLRREKTASLQGVSDDVEDKVVRAVHTWLTELGDTDRLDDVVAHRRSTSTIYDAAYVWSGDRLVWPPEPIYPEADALRQDPCLVAAAKASGDDSVALAQRYLDCTHDLTDAGKLLAVSDAAEALLNSDHAADAATMLDRTGYVTVPIRWSAKIDASPTHLVLLKEQMARALQALGYGDGARRLLHDTLKDVASLDGPYLEGTLPLYVWPLAHDMKELGGPSYGDEEEDEQYARAQRRLAAWRELDRKVWMTETLGGVDAPVVLVDRYDTPPWMVYAARLGNGLVGAVQVDQSELVNAVYGLLSRPNLAPYLSIRDDAGHVLRGNSDAVAISVDLDHIAPNLHACLSTNALEDTRNEQRALYGHLAPIGFTILVGLTALGGMIRTDRRQERLLAQQREFMARVTHELKTPIAGIQLMAETLEMGAFAGDEGRIKFAKQIVKEAERLTRRVDEILRAARSPTDEKTEAVDLGQMVRQIEERWRPLFEQRGATLAVEAPESVPARVRPDPVRDALTNLVDNALKYAKEGRPLSVVLRVHADRRWVTFDVEDNGIGVPAPMRKTVFERFRRVEGPGRGKAGGHGLGLAFVAAAASAHKGKVECREGREGGARFVMRIRRYN